MKTIFCSIFLVIAIASMMTSNSYAAANGCIREEIGDQKPIEFVSIIEVISRPEKFDGKCIQTMGFSSITDFEDVALYIDREAYEYRMTANALWLEGAGDNPSNREYDRRYVRVEGVFRFDRRGYGRLYSGGIDKVRILYAYNGPDQYKLIRQKENSELRKKTLTVLFLLFAAAVTITFVALKLIRCQSHVRN
jgi:hypothetical protein